jgi:hypothetical protein
MVHYLLDCFCQEGHYGCIFQATVPPSSTPFDMFFQHAAVKTGDGTERREKEGGEREMRRTYYSTHLWPKLSLGQVP